MRRTWLFVPGADEAAHEAAARSGADVVILELEDFTPPELRPLEVYAEERKEERKVLVRREEYQEHARTGTTTPASGESMRAAAQGLSVQLAVPERADREALLDAVMEHAIAQVVEAMKGAEPRRGEPVDAQPLELVGDPDERRGLVQRIAVRHLGQRGRELAARPEHLRVRRRPPTGQRGGDRGRAPNRPMAGSAARVTGPSTTSAPAAAARTRSGTRPAVATPTSTTSGASTASCSTTPPSSHGSVERRFSAPTPARDSVPYAVAARPATPMASRVLVPESCPLMSPPPGGKPTSSAGRPAGSGR